jgi:glyoxylase-like metal-dependent hydrolase (beta-lactamase superfamily II)
MEKGKIYTFRCGKSNSYLFEGSMGMLLIDAGGKELPQKLKNYLTEIDRTPAEIKGIILTHTHYDHVDSLAEVRDMTGAPVVVHRKEAADLTRGRTDLPPGNSLFPKLVIALSRLKKGVDSYPAVEPDIVFDDELGLERFDIPGRVLHIPGHSSGSACVVIDDFCFCGDTLFHVVPGRLMPPFVEDRKALCKSWKRLLDTGCTMFYPGHGKPVTGDLLSAAFKRCLEKVS